MLTISQVTKAFGGRTLFEDASLQVNRGDRVGLVGPNGAGKSTLFSLILGEASPDAGKVSMERSASLGFLPQESAPAGEETVLELACSASPKLANALRVMKATPTSKPCGFTMKRAAGNWSRKRSGSWPGWHSGKMTSTARCAP
jgi:ATP-binding cassette subfamily F protein 3